MRINLPNGKVLFLRLNMDIINPEEAVIGLHSGSPFRGSHFIFLDFDNIKSIEAIRRMQHITKKYQYRRSLVIESSPNKYWGISFSPTEFQKMLKIQSESGEDENHTHHTLSKGYSVIRMSIKKAFIPRIAKIIVNEDGTNFYNYKIEEVFLNRLKVMAHGKE